MIFQMGSTKSAVAYRENWFAIVRDVFSFPSVSFSSSRTVGGLWHITVLDGFHLACSLYSK